jgi:hypothetical protein
MLWFLFDDSLELQATQTEKKIISMSIIMKNKWRMQSLPHRKCGRRQLGVHSRVTSMSDFSSPQDSAELLNLDVQLWHPTTGSRIPIGNFLLFPCALKAGEEFIQREKITRPNGHYGGDAIIVSGLSCPIAHLSPSQATAPIRSSLVIIVYGLYL